MANMTSNQQVLEINWQKVNGLLPVIIQDANSSEVLMLGYMDQQALQKTLDEKKVTFFSRTKKRLWTKGETSGNFLNVVEVGLDCDQDCLLILVKPIGATCHKGTTSCFDGVSAMPDWVFLAQLEKLVATRKHVQADESYTASLYAQGTKRIAQKVGEEGVETALAAATGDKNEVICEAADLVFHLTVLLQDQNLTWSDVLTKLKQRNGK